MFATWFALAAHAANEDLTISGMAEHGGQNVTIDLQPVYLDLIGELGSVVANKPLYPAKTLGASGFDLSLSNTFAFITDDYSDGTPGPWSRANVDEDVANGYAFVPQISVRKGLPLSLEVGATAGWIGLSHSGTFGAFARGAFVEGHKPWPDLSAHIGYAGFVGNDELELAALDMGATFGSSFAFGSFPGIHNAVWQPYLDVSIVHVRAFPSVDAADAPFAVPLGTQDGDSIAGLWQPQYAAGFQLVNGTVLFRVLGTWSPQTIASLTLGMGWTY